jgi:hypothetical protein
MKPHRYQWVVIFWLLLLFHASATVLYVDLNSTNPTPPYADWTTAATNIQDAIDASTNGDLILVTNGVYATGGRALGSFDVTNRVTMTNAVTVQSFNGPAVTVIQGYQVAGTSGSTSAVRCALLGSGALLSGFTLTNGEAGIGNYVNGGGVAGAFGSSAVVSNCVLTGNICAGGGGGADRVALISCVLTRNQAQGGGAAIDAVLGNCIITNNSAGWAGGMLGCQATNCVIANNSATNYGGGSGFSTLVNCTVAANSLQPGYGGNGGGSYQDTLFNCIVYNNTAPNGSNYYSSGMASCCTAPLAGGPGNITGTPLFVNPTAGDFHLQSNSPCINAGNNAYMTVGTDLDGHPRAVGGAVDIGAYEFQGNVHYVSLSGTNPLFPYSDWSVAATNIQDAVDAAANGDLVLVTNGVYRTGGRIASGSPSGFGGGGSNRVTIAKAVTVQSLSGPALTVIQGNQVPGTKIGIGAVRCVWLTNGAVLSGFTLTNGAATSSNVKIDGTGGGAFSSGVISNCVFVGNIAAGGGGVFGGTLNNCTLIANSTSSGGIGGGTWYATLNNCVIASNSASGGFGGGAGTYCSVNSCTIVFNSAGSGGGSYGGALTNCIVYSNTGGNYGYSTLNYCCTTPLPGGTGNITNDPAFVNPNGGDFHLQSNSPCINAGNNTYVSGTNDLDGNPRIVGGTVDIGAYEFQSPVSQISYAWLQQYGLPISTNTDFSDADNDGMNNWQEWRTGTNPTNALSVLKMASAAATNNPPGMVVMWQSVSGINYFLQRSTNLTAQPAFSTIQSNIVGQAGTTSYMDTTATNGGPYFYRVGVQ